MSMFIKRVDAVTSILSLIATAYNVYSLLQDLKTSNDGGKTESDNDVDSLVDENKELFDI